jgi:LacI family transcriptional regulator
VDRHPHVALMIDTTTVYGRRLIQGITRYLRSHRSWSIFLEQRAIDKVPPRWLRTWRGDGLISRWNNPRVNALLGKLGPAAVDLSDCRPAFGLPRINSDDRAIGRLAAEHLSQRGLRSFACCGFSDELWSTRRRDAFLEGVAQVGEGGRIFESPWRESYAHLPESEEVRIGRWLKALPRPVGVMATNDLRGHDVLNACQHSGLRVPEEVAVVGVDDDTLLCEVSSPPLSSIIPNAEQIGYEAASLLDRQMVGGRVDFEEWFIPPVGVTIRLSTDVLSVDDPQLASAVRFIRQNACRGITVGDVLDHIPLSRSTLERRFRSYLGRSLQSEIRAVQLARAKELLGETNHALHRVAELVGYEHSEYFSVVFKREVGLTPSQFRQQATAVQRTGAGKGIR